MLTGTYRQAPSKPAQNSRKAEDEVGQVPIQMVCQQCEILKYCGTVYVADHSQKNDQILMMIIWSP